MAIEKIRVNGVDYDLGVSGGSEGSGGGMPDLAYNNPDLPIYYGMGLKGKSKIKIDFVKMVSWVRNCNYPKITNYLDQAFTGLGSSSAKYAGYYSLLRLYNIINSGASGLDNSNTATIRLNLDGYFKLEYGESDFYSPITIHQVTSSDGSTLAQFIEKMGTVEIPIDEMLSNLNDKTQNGTSNWDLANAGTLLVVDLFNTYEQNGGEQPWSFKDLNTYPIDFITIE